VPKIRAALNIATPQEAAQLKCDEWNKAHGFEVKKNGVTLPKDYKGFNHKDRRDFKFKRGRFAKMDDK
jgi:hypothetical protein